jgi:Methyltransferase domain
MSTPGDNFTRQLESLDLSLFKGVGTQSSDGDRRSWLAVQRSVRKPSGYTYLEIGSYLGGSLQQHLVDPWCRQIISIDNRPASPPDDRGEGFHYVDNSTARMLDNLRRVAPDQLSKVICYDVDAKEIDPRAIPGLPEFCFIDGEHTHAAVLSDFEFCLSVCAPNAAICFHDDYIVYKALEIALNTLRRRDIPFTARKLDGVTFGIFLRDCVAANDPYLRGSSQDAVRWIRGQRLRALLPGRLRSALRSLRSGLSPA